MWSRSPARVRHRCRRSPVTSGSQSRVCTAGSRTADLRTLPSGASRRCAGCSPGRAAHPNTVRLRLDQLVTVRLVTRERERPSRPGRPRMVYAAVPMTHGRDEPDGYWLLAEILVSSLEQTSAEPAQVATSAGRAWGQGLVDPPSRAPGSQADVAQAIDQVAALLDDLGFQAWPTDTSPTIEMHRCPFHQVAENHSQVVAGMHLGLCRRRVKTDSPWRRVKFGGSSRFVVNGPAVRVFTLRLSRRRQGGYVPGSCWGWGSRGRCA